MLALTHPSRRRLAMIGWTLLALVGCLGFLGRDASMGSHELRVVNTSRTMANAGWPWNATASIIPRAVLEKSPNGSRMTPDPGGATWTINPWLVPVFEGQIRLQKPPLPYWATATCFKLLGEGPGSARLVPALLGVASCLLTYRLARAVAGRRAAMIALALATSSWFVISEYRKSMADPYLACMTLAATVCWIDACRSRFRDLLVTLFYASLALATMVKGPVAFLHVGVALGAFSFCFRRRPEARRRAHVIGMLAFVLIAVPWPAYVIARVPGAIEIWRYESIGEFADNLRNARPFYFYLPGLLLIAAPWVVPWMRSLSMPFATRQRHRRFATIWLAIIVVVFSCSHMKKYAYLLPVVPAMTLGSAQAVVRLMAEARRRRDSKPLRWIASGHWIAGIAFAVAIFVTSMKFVDRRPIAIAVGIAALAIALVPIIAFRRFAFERWVALQAIAFALLIALFLSFPQAGRHASKHSAQDDALMMGDDDGKD